MAHIAVTVTERVRAPVHNVFNFVVAEDVLPKILLGYGPVPGVTATSGNTGPWDVPGSARTVHLKGGDTAKEQVTDFEAPSYFAYRVTDFTFALKHFATQGRGQWWFTPTEGGTQVKWTYTFTARSRLTQPILAVFARLLWRGYMRVAMRETRTQLEGQPTAVRVVT